MKVIFDLIITVLILTLIGIILKAPNYYISHELDKNFVTALSLFLILIGTYIKLVNEIKLKKRINNTDTIIGLISILVSLAVLENKYLLMPIIASLLFCTGQIVIIFNNYSSQFINKIGKVLTVGTFIMLSIYSFSFLILNYSVK